MKTLKNFVYVIGGENPFRVSKGYTKILVLDKYGQVMKEFGLTEDQAAETFAASLNQK